MAPDEPPAAVQLSLTVEPRRATRSRAALPRAAKMIAIAGALAAGVVGAGLGMSGTMSGTHARPGEVRARAPGPLGVAAAYGYPLRCLSVAIAVHDPRFARADLNHDVSCGLYVGYTTAIFHRVDGAWVPVLEATSYPCPVRSLPARIQVELGVCLPRGPAHARRARGSRRVNAATSTSRTASWARASSNAGP